MSRWNHCLSHIALLQLNMGSGSNTRMKKSVEVLAHLIKQSRLAHHGRKGDVPNFRTSLASSLLLTEETLSRAVSNENLVSN